MVEQICAQEKRQFCRMQVKLRKFLHYVYFNPVGQFFYNQIINISEETLQKKLQQLDLLDFENVY